MAQKRYARAAGSKRRHLDEQRRKATDREYKPKEGKRPMTRERDEADLAHAQEVLDLQQEVRKYRDAWNAEKTTNAGHKAQLAILRKQQSTIRGQRVTGAWTLVAVGAACLLVGVMIGAALL